MTDSLSPGDGFRDVLFMARCRRCFLQRRGGLVTKEERGIGKGKGEREGEEEGGRWSLIGGFAELMLCC